MPPCVFRNKCWNFGLFISDILASLDVDYASSISQQPIWWNRWTAPLAWWCPTRFKQILWTFFFSFCTTNFRDINLVLEIQIQMSNGELLCWPLLIMNKNIKYKSNTKQIWKTLSPPRVSFFVWEVALGKISDDK